MKALPLAAALLCAVVLPAWLASAPQQAAVTGPGSARSDSEDPAASDRRMIQQLENLHGSKFRHTPSVVRVSRDHLREKVRLDLAHRFPPGAADARRRAALVMGLTRLPFDWVDSLTGIAIETTACHYEESSNRFLIHETPDPAAPAQILFEMARALILQSTPLRKSPASHPVNDDATLAAQCVIQGAAARLRTGYLLAHPEDPSPASLPSPLVFHYEAPPFLRSRMLFPVGMSVFFENVLLENLRVPEARAVMLSGLFSRPPRSTAEVMHPELYQNPATPAPLEVVLPAAAMDGATLIFENVLGEFGTLQVLKTYLTQERANDAAAGWRGDRYQLYGSPAGRGDAVVWQTEWSTESGAADFLAAAHEWLAARFSISPAGAGGGTASGGREEGISAATFRTMHQPGTLSVRLLLSADPAMVRRLEPAFFSGHALR